MAKGQLRSNREHKKPKQVRGVVTTPASSMVKNPKAAPSVHGKKK